MRWRTVADPGVRGDLCARLCRLSADTPRRASPHYNPHTLGTRPGTFAVDLARAVDGLQRLGLAGDDAALEPAHGFFGSMSVRDWQRWAWKHTEHHLRQFGV
jgi:hypothetical protein